MFSISNRFDTFWLHKDFCAALIKWNEAKGMQHVPDYLRPNDSKQDVWERTHRAKITLAWIKTKIQTHITANGSPADLSQRYFTENKPNTAQLN